MTSAERAEILFNQGLDVVDVAINLGALDTCANWAARCADDMTAIRREIDAAVAEALAARWVPAGERLPEHTRAVLVTALVRSRCLAPGPVVLEARYDGGRWYRSDGSWLTHDVLAWQPLPAPLEAP